MKCICSVALNHPVNHFTHCSWSAQQKVWQAFLSLSSSIISTRPSVACSGKKAVVGKERVVGNHAQSSELFACMERGHKYWMRCNLFYFLELHNIVANLGLHKWLHFEFARPCVLQMGKGFLELLLVGNLAGLAGTSQSLSNRLCSPNTCSLEWFHCLSFLSWLLRPRKNV